MSLILGAAVRDKFVLMSSDSRVTEQEYLDDYTTTRGEIKIVGDMVQPKAMPLTSNVLITVGGIVETGTHVLNELGKLVEHDDSLERCAELLEQVILELWEQRVPQNPFTIKEETREASLNFLASDKFGCYLFGFMSNGNTGVAAYNPLEMIVKVSENDSEQHPVTALVFSPSEDNNRNYTKWLDLKGDDQTLENYLEQFMLVHSKLSYDSPVTISPDCNYIGIVKDKEGKTKTAGATADTSELYPLFEENPQIDHRRLWRLPSE